MDVPALKQQLRQRPIAQIGKRFPGSVERIMGCGTACPYRRNAVKQKRHFAHMAAAVLKVVLLLRPEAL